MSRRPWAPPTAHLAVVRYRILAPLPAAVVFPWTVYRVQIRPVPSGGGFKLVGSDERGNELRLATAISEAFLRKQCYERGFDVPAASIPEVLMGKMVRDGQAAFVPAL